MNELMRAYIDSFNQITIIMHKSIANYHKVFYLVDLNNKIKLHIDDCLFDNDNLKYVIKHDLDISLNKEYKILDNDNYECLLYCGSVTRDPLFDETFRYDGPLGYEYHKEYTIFRLWTPVAKSIKLVINKTEEYELEYSSNGLWSVKIDKDLELSTYYYMVKIFENYMKVTDPYNIASNALKESYIIDLNKLYKKKYYPKYNDINTKAIIYEASVRDLTSSLTSKNKGTYLGVVENNVTKSGLPTGLEYIKFLGVTHLQLLPVFSFGGIDEISKDDYYNWGYNPVEFLVPSGWYSQHPYDPYSRINELKMLVDEANKLNIKVNMDVVFNHVYDTKTFPFDFLVPGYYYRHHNGWGTNSSGCGNDLASEKYMCRKFIIDCLKYYVNVFDMSGFRFDLMGLLDSETMNLARKELLALNPHLMIYGEGWDMPAYLPLNLKASMNNHKNLPKIGFFNDTYRDTLRGNPWNPSHYGYALGYDTDLQKMFYLLTGSCVDEYLVKLPQNTINYVECHDNYTFYDFGLVLAKKPRKLLKDYSLLALQIVLISNGVPFIHAGQEFLRTKMGVENAYMSSDRINMLSYDRRDSYKNNVLAIKDLIEIRKEYPLFSSNSVKEIVSRIIIDDRLTDLNHIVLRHSYTDYDLLIILKNHKEEVVFEENNCIMIYNARKKVDISKKKYILDQIGVYIFKEIKE